MRYLLLSSFLFISLFVQLDRIFLKQNGSFSQKFTLPNWSKCAQWETSVPSNIHTIVDQPFTYLTKGKQCFVFLSEDQQWVIKFFRLPKALRRHCVKNKELRSSFFSQSLLSCYLAYQELSQETQIAYAHLKPSNCLTKVTLIDRMGVHHHCLLDDQLFFIQRFGKPFFQVFDECKDREELIRKTVQLYSRVYDKSMIDRDSIFDKNFGVVDGQPFIIDIGQLEKSSSLPPREEYLSQMMGSLQGKLTREFPSLFSYYKNLLH